VNCKSSKKKNIFNAIVGLFSLVGVKLSVFDAAEPFSKHQPVLQLELKKIKRFYNRLLKPLRLKLIANDTKWERVFADTNANAIIALIFSVKHNTGDEYHNRVTIYDSVSKIFVPFNRKGTACYIRETVYAAATDVDHQGMHQPITAALHRHLYPGVTNIQLLVVYKLYKF